jgi:hypothetical protein
MPCHAAFAPQQGARPPDLFFFRGHLWVYFRYGPVTRSPSLRWLCQSASSALLSSADAAQAKGLLTFAPVGLPPILLNMSTFSDRTAAQKFRLASKSTDTMGEPANQPFNLICVHCCLRGAARNRWTRDGGRDELGTDWNRPILSQLPSSEFSQTIHYHTGNGTDSSLLCPRAHSGVTLELCATVFQVDGNYPVHRRCCSHLSNPPFTQRSFPTGIQDGGRRELREPRPCSLVARNVSRLIEVGQ